MEKIAVSLLLGAGIGVGAYMIWPEWGGTPERKTETMTRETHKLMRLTYDCCLADGKTEILRIEEMLKQAEQLVDQQQCLPQTLVTVTGVISVV